jgi:hypothetical protein
LTLNRSARSFTFFGVSSTTRIFAGEFISGVVRRRAVALPRHFLIRSLNRVL